MITKNSIKQVIVTSKEVLDILGISRQRLNQLEKSKKLIPIKKGSYFLEEVLKRKDEQQVLRALYARTRQGEIEKTNITKSNK